MKPRKHSSLRFFNGDIPVYPRGDHPPRYHSRKITFSRGETSINFAVLLISRGRTPREKFQDSVARRLRAEWSESSSTSVLFSLAQVVYSRDKLETGRYIRSIHPTESSPAFRVARSPRESRAGGKSWRQTVGEFRW